MNLNKPMLHAGLRHLNYLSSFLQVSTNRKETGLGSMRGLRSHSSERKLRGEQGGAGRAVACNTVQCGADASKGEAGCRQACLQAAWKQGSLLLPGLVTLASKAGGFWQISE